MRVASAVKLSQPEREKLLRAAQSQRSEIRRARRAGIVLLCADGLDNRTVGEMLEIDRIQVGRWRERYAVGGFTAIEHDLPRGGRRAVHSPAEIVRLTTQTTPAVATQWSSRPMAEAVGQAHGDTGRTISHSTGQSHLEKYGLKPHRVARFKVSRDPRFVEKLNDIVGLYLSPPEHALVLCCDEKSQIQALDRTQPGLPMKKGRAATMTHGYKRH